MTRRRNVNMTESQLDAVSYACHAMLAEPANFEGDNAKLERPMRNAFAKVQSALEKLQESPR